MKRGSFDDPRHLTMYIVDNWKSELSPGRNSFAERRRTHRMNSERQKRRTTASTITDYHDLSISINLQMLSEYQDCMVGATNDNDSVVIFTFCR